MPSGRRTTTLRTCAVAKAVGALLCGTFTSTTRPVGASAALDNGCAVTVGLNGRRSQPVVANGTPLRPSDSGVLPTSPGSCQELTLTVIGRAESEHDVGFVRNGTGAALLLVGRALLTGVNRSASLRGSAGTPQSDRSIRRIGLACVACRDADEIP